MNQRTIAHALASAVIGLSTSALAATPQTGEIHITGKVIATTCTVESASTNVTVTLPPVDVSSLSAEGSSAAPTQFTITVDGCTFTDDSPSTVSVAFVPDSNSVDANGDLKNLTSGGAQEVAVRILDSNQNTVNINTDTASAQWARGASTNVAGQKIPLRYYAQYYSAQGGTTAGAVSAVAHFQLVYE